MARPLNGKTPEEDLAWQMARQMADEIDHELEVDLDYVPIYEEGDYVLILALARAGRLVQRTKGKDGRYHYYVEHIRGTETSVHTFIELRNLTEMEVIAWVARDEDNNQSRSTRPIQ